MDISNNLGYKVSDEEELAAVDHEISQLASKIEALQNRKQLLLQRKRSIKDRMLLKKSEVLASKDWNRRDFPWSDQLLSSLQSVFLIQQFRPYQEAAINAILSKEDCILIMPTGGGKSLCYQLPAVIFEGFVLVVCPLVSLMEDQMIYLRKINYPAYTLSQNTPKEEVNLAHMAMTDKKAPMKLLYVTPERMAKSKRFMNKLQAAYSMGRVSCIAIDEVHCCSQWGHDFQPDYKYLGVLKGMFPGVPIFGVTATATTKIIVDVQKILNIEGCMVLKSSFNRPNLYYEVRPKPLIQKEYLNELEDLLKHKYAEKSGIIYTTTIKDAEDTVTELRKRSLKVVFYHANMDPDLRVKAHHGWRTGKYQAVIATIAFGMGIDKPDVRFVIHQSLSKSMENYYQESGRAGRDGQPADCILFYRLVDAFKTSTMGFSEHNALENLYSVVDYCLSATSCRRSLIASHFDEGWESSDCKKMCDNCKNPCESTQLDITCHCIAICKIIEFAAKKDTKLTVTKLLDSWFNKGPVALRLPNHEAPKILQSKGENIIGYLLINSYLKEDFHYTAYSCISYLQKGPRAFEIFDTKFKLVMEVKGKKLPSPLSNNSTAHEPSKNGEKMFSSSVTGSSSSQKGKIARNSNKSEAECIGDCVEISDSDDSDFEPKAKKKYVSPKGTDKGLKKTKINK